MMNLKIIKLLIFAILIFTLLVNFANFFYVKYYYGFTDYNSKIYSSFDAYKYARVDSVTDNDYRKFCLSMKPDLFYPTYIESSHWALTTILISSMVIIVASWKKIILKSDRRKLLLIFFLAFIIGFYVWLQEVTDYYYFNNCWKYLL